MVPCSLIVKFVFLIPWLSWQCIAGGVVSCTTATTFYRFFVEGRSSWSKSGPLILAQALLLSYQAALNAARLAIKLLIVRLGWSLCQAWVPQDLTVAA